MFQLCGDNDGLHVDRLIGCAAPGLDDDIHFTAQPGQQTHQPLCRDIPKMTVAEPRIFGWVMPISSAALVWVRP